MERFFICLVVGRRTSALQTSIQAVFLQFGVQQLPMNTEPAGGLSTIILALIQCAPAAWSKYAHGSAFYCRQLRRDS